MFSSQVRHRTPMFYQSFQSSQILKQIAPFSTKCFETKFSERPSTQEVSNEEKLVRVFNKYTLLTQEDTQDIFEMLRHRIAPIFFNKIKLKDLKKINDIIKSEQAPLQESLGTPLSFFYSSSAATSVFCAVDYLNSMSCYQPNTILAATTLCALVNVLNRIIKNPNSEKINGNQKVIDHIENIIRQRQSALVKKKGLLNHRVLPLRDGTKKKIHEIFKAYHLEKKLEAELQNDSEFLAKIKLLDLQQIKIKLEKNKKEIQLTESHEKKAFFHSVAMATAIYVTHPFFYIDPQFTESDIYNFILILSVPVIALSGPLTFPASLFTAMAASNSVFRLYEIKKFKHLNEDLTNKIDLTIKIKENQII